MNRFNILDFGAKADGKTDCTLAIQQALDEAGKEKQVITARNLLDN